MNESQKQTIYIVLAVLALSLLPALFNDTEAAEAYVELHGASRHFLTESEYNEQNYGVGIRVERKDGTAVMAGVYRNSYDHTSLYASVGQYMRRGPLQVGFEAGLVTGYPMGAAVPVGCLSAKMGPVRVRLLPIDTPVMSVSLEVPIH